MWPSEGHAVALERPRWGQRASAPLVSFEADQPTCRNGGKQSLFQCFSQELKQRLRSGIVGQAEVRVDLVVVGLFGTEDRDGNARVFQHVTKTLRLRARVRMIGDVQDQERRNSFVLGNMRDGGEVTMLRGIVTELLTVPEFRLRQTMHPTPGLRCLN